jgi:hypothetical protein
MTKTVLGIFQDDSDVKKAIDKLKSEGFKPEDFLIVINNMMKAKELSDDTGANVSSDAQYYERLVKEGAILLAVPTRENQLELVMTIFDDSNTTDVKIISHPVSETVMTPLSEHAYNDNRSYVHVGEKGGKVGTLSKETIKRAKAL